MNNDLAAAIEKARQLPDDEQEKLAEKIAPIIDHVRESGSLEGFSAASDLLPAVLNKLKLEE